MSAQIIAMMLGVSIFLGAAALIALLWGMKTGQFDDQAKFIDAARYDNEEDLQEAANSQIKKENLMNKKQKDSKSKT